MPSIALTEGEATVRRRGTGDNVPVTTAKQPAAAALDEPTTAPARSWVLALTLLNLGIMSGWFGPIQVLLAEQAADVSPGNKEGALSLVLGLGALTSAISNPVFGAFSDRTRLRVGRRFPWIIGGSLGGAAMLGLLAIAERVEAHADQVVHDRLVGCQLDRDQGGIQRIAGPGLPAGQQGPGEGEVGQPVVRSQVAQPVAGLDRLPLVAEADPGAGQQHVTVQPGRVERDRASREVGRLVVPIQLVQRLGEHDVRRGRVRMAGQVAGRLPTGVLRPAQVQQRVGTGQRPVVRTTVRAVALRHGPDATPGGRLLRAAARPGGDHRRLWGRWPAVRSSRDR